MQQRMQVFELKRPRTEKNSWSESVQHFELVGNVRAAVSAANGGVSEQNQALRIKSTHRAVTQDDVRVGDRLGEYVVDFVIPGRRYTQLFLTKETPV